MSNSDRKELIAIRISLRCIAEKVGLLEELPFEKLSQEAGYDRGWNLLGAEIRGAIEKLQKQRDAAINANADCVAQIMHDDMKQQHGCTDAYCSICDGETDV